MSHAGLIKCFGTLFIRDSKGLADVAENPNRFRSSCGGVGAARPLTSPTRAWAPRNLSRSVLPSGRRRHADKVRREVRPCSVVAARQSQSCACLGLRTRACHPPLGGGRGGDRAVACVDQTTRWKRLLGSSPNGKPTTQPYRPCTLALGQQEVQQPDQRCRVVRDDMGHQHHHHEVEGDQRQPLRQASRRGMGFPAGGLRRLIIVACVTRLSLVRDHPWSCPPCWARPAGFR